ncbi:helix-turn-helix domain-containing protein [Acidaminobacter hydrogenoformans]|uniref:DNA binding domain-containing protein, excisionase family n=1 Tax=Acidaminobacter hydrogenoformans DSM 2784 TaxID=1120920 RepID=A0A1G5RWQ6_9FIRM|nr:helix-turn-helix domain-containing protein [Acidaminobacter hydrogenoformans]SCZ78298.1 DNA binding domain-containing protein, excisionase family [Acidaminobacter hydrogenoformans DSM 2784]
MEDKLFTIEEVAERLGVHSKTIRRYLYSGKLGGQKVGSQWRISQSALDAFLKSGESSCHHSPAAPSSDDFCVYMDTDLETFSTERKLRICSIIDYDVDSAKEIAPLSIALMQAIETVENCEDCRFNHVYEPSEKRVRFVLWASPLVMIHAMEAIQKFDQKKTNFKED